MEEDADAMSTCPVCLEPYNKDNNTPSSCPVG